jgi:hypothetical protein
MVNKKYPAPRSRSLLTMRRFDMKVAHFPSPCMGED